MLLLIYVLIIAMLMWGHMPCVRIKIQNKEYEINYSWIICVVYLSILMNTTNVYADLENYEKIYDVVFDKGILKSGYMKEMPGWVILCSLFSHINMNYRGMTLGILLLSFYIIHRGLQALQVKDEKKFWGLYLVFPALINCVQLRMFLGMAIVVYFVFASLAKPRYMVLYCALCMIISSLFHKSCLIFIILWIPLFIIKINKRRIFIIEIMAVTIISVFMNTFLDIIQKILPSGKYNRFFVNSITPSSLDWIIKILFTWGVLIIAFHVIKKSIMEHFAQLYDNNINKELIEPIELRCLYNCAFILGGTLMLLYFDKNFHRFLEVGYIFLFSVYSKFYISIMRNDKNKIIIPIFIVVLLLITHFYTPFKTILKPFFSFEGFHSLTRI